MNTFTELKLDTPILKAIEKTGYLTPTEIQQKAIPILLDKKDILGSAQTGTGKTAAFAIPILQMLNQNINDKKVIRALILTPTRELANQIYENFIQYAYFIRIRTNVIYGGVPQKKQEDALKKGTDVLIATPGRLLDLMSQKIIDLRNIEYLVLDEADQMLDMGFIKDIYKILKQVPEKRQTMLFSATMPKKIEEFANSILKNPERIAVTPVTKTLDAIKQELYLVPKNNKNELLNHLIKKLNMDSVLVFTKTKHGANKVVKELLKNNITAEPIHGNKSQAARERALLNFKNRKTQVLVATDIAARGLDIKQLSFVINYDLPDTPETYIHRIGRTGRAGELGLAISFCSDEEKNLLIDIEKHIKNKLTSIENHPYGKTYVKTHDIIDNKQNDNKKNKPSNPNHYKKTKNKKFVIGTRKTK
ncbi:ATP-dependent RNA helicase, superfamily II [Alteracholeplasma palmae J233]|uniref:RNA helicase n=1 Tax=Alteracholeplasma palmae (strain ATCC 49389 / J233) TaxID=1318466 RepID=U4KLD9_ALTPJ|nr:DEAD/DEAH box helicase [Alteracholeplasma palmae]CCV64623.1 ATP-dependent RNA helicase, superfamily II [Alteracholeplasma palmae J233]